MEKIEEQTMFHRPKDSTGKSIIIDYQKIIEEIRENLTCNLTLDIFISDTTPGNPVTLGCNHTFSEMIIEWIGQSKYINCPCCKKVYSGHKKRPDIANMCNIVGNQNALSKARVCDILNIGLKKFFQQNQSISEFMDITIKNIIESSVTIIVGKNIEQIKNITEIDENILTRIENLPHTVQLPVLAFIYKHAEISDFTIPVKHFKNSDLDIETKVNIFLSLQKKYNTLCFFNEFYEIIFRERDFGKELLTKKIELFAKDEISSENHYINKLTLIYVLIEALKLTTKEIAEIIKNDGNIAKIITRGDVFLKSSLKQKRFTEAEKILSLILRLGRIAEINDDKHVDILSNELYNRIKKNHPNFIKRIYKIIAKIPGVKLVATIRKKIFIHLLNKLNSEWEQRKFKRCCKILQHLSKEYDDHDNKQLLNELVKIYPALSEIKNSPSNIKDYCVIISPLIESKTLPSSANLSLEVCCYNISRANNLEEAYSIYNEFISQNEQLNKKSRSKIDKTFGNKIDKCIENKELCQNVVNILIQLKSETPHNYNHLLNKVLKYTTLLEMIYTNPEAFETILFFIKDTNQVFSAYRTQAWDIAFQLYRISKKMHSKLIPEQNIINYLEIVLKKLEDDIHTKKTINYFEGTTYRKILEKFLGYVGELHTFSGASKLMGLRIQLHINFGYIVPPETSTIVEAPGLAELHRALVDSNRTLSRSNKDCYFVKVRSFLLMILEEDSELDQAYLFLKCYMEKLSENPELLINFGSYGSKNFHYMNLAIVLSYIANIIERNQNDPNKSNNPSAKELTHTVEIIKKTINFCFMESLKLSENSLVLNYYNNDRINQDLKLHRYLSVCSNVEAHLFKIKLSLSFPFSPKLFVASFFKNSLKENIYKSVENLGKKLSFNFESATIIIDSLMKNEPTVEPRHLVTFLLSLLDQIQDTECCKKIIYHYMNTFEKLQIASLFSSEQNNELFRPATRKLIPFLVNKEIELPELPTKPRDPATQSLSFT